MTAPGNDLLFLVLSLSILLSSAYAVGRIHQWHRHGVERDEAYRLGYDEASLSILGMMNGRRPTGLGKAAILARLTTDTRSSGNGRHTRGGRAARFSLRHGDHSRTGA